MTRKKTSLKVRVSDGVAFVNTTDVRNQLTAIYKKVLKKYDTVVIEKKGKPVAVLKPIESAAEAIKVEEF